MNLTGFSITIGVDIAKKKFDVASLMSGKYKHKSFDNNESGFIAFIAWFLPQCGDNKPLICMESTGTYSLALADFLVGQGHAVSLVNPANNIVLPKVS